LNSAGNDIVALNMIDPGRSQFPGFYKKILSPSELTLFTGQVTSGESAVGPLSFGHFLWLLWSIKESVYKYVKQTTPAFIFSPTRIVTQNLDVAPRIPGIDTAHFFTARAQAGTCTFHTRSFITDDCIFTMANGTDDFRSVQWGLHSIDGDSHEDQSRAVRACLVQRLETLLPGAGWRVQKSPEGHPLLLKGHRPSGIPVSFAHHGSFVGYSFYLTPSSGSSPVSPGQP
jgi:phosphopantetheinyl transferase (holo-ACP synthase)